MRGLRADDPLSSFEVLMESSLDVTGAEVVDVKINKTARTLHVNVNGVCLLRVCRVAHFEVEVQEPIGDRMSGVPSDPTTVQEVAVR